MLIKQAVLEGLVAGRISLAFRRWKRPTVRAGGTLRTGLGVLAIEAVDEVGDVDLSETEAHLAGFPSLAALQENLDNQRDGTLYRIALRYAGPDPRDALRSTARLSASEVAELRERLERWDASSRVGAWTVRVLQGIAENEGLRAAELAKSLDLDAEWLKVNIRKLKELGLTESLSPGYRLSARGSALLRFLVVEGR